MRHLLASIGFAALLTAVVAALSTLQRSGVPLAVASVLLWTSVVIVLIIVERVVPFERAWLVPDEQLGNDVVHTVIGSAVGSHVGSIAAEGAVAIVAFAAPALTLWPSSLPFAVQVGIGFVVVDGVRFGQHWLSHRVPALWETHKLHHDARRLIVMKAGRAHFFDRAAQALCVVPVIVAGAPVDVVFWCVALNSVIGLIAHANVDVAGLIVVGPREHRVHHARDAEGHGANFGAALTIWDRLCGTFRSATVTTVGLDEATPSTVVSQLAAPVQAWVD